jgi:hypothetical protein
MTRQEAWVRFAAGALADPNVDARHAANAADGLLKEMLERWPETPGIPPQRPPPKDGGAG